ncbi:hypothetical protein MAPG_01540 [Magnaporthiopsis poae ATCC 64411]|uniref:2-haloalkanoic acid dehalogenase n=1 Tax=Magnaporthiopsis poae (strain ATCC 64411 / 73-15) TaxID=644358 RepID=A0A0C4DNZ1_MAGP6|nr:hypothetical protein MAPG_01540 [Magnaporthiopsis poae ATCC 64411]
MSSPRKHVVFDVVGTCVSYDGIFEALDARLGDKLRAEGIKPKLLGYAWLEAAEREYTYLSISNRYRRFDDVFRSLFYRVLWFAGVEQPRAFATEADLDFRVRGYFVRNGIDMPLENFRTCDQLKVGKPAPEAYRHMLDGFAGEEAWFAAAHMWDVSAAKAMGFKGAYCSIMEKEPCIDIFGEVDVMTDNFPDLARKLIEQSEKNAQ